MVGIFQSVCQIFGDNVYYILFVFTEFVIISNIMYVIISVRIAVIISVIIPAFISVIIYV